MCCLTIILWTHCNLLRQKKRIPVVVWSLDWIPSLFCCCVVWFLGSGSIRGSYQGWVWSSFACFIWFFEGMIGKVWSWCWCVCLRKSLKTGSNIAGKIISDLPSRKISLGLVFWVLSFLFWTFSYGVCLDNDSFPFLSVLLAWILFELNKEWHECDWGESWSLWRKLHQFLFSSNGCMLFQNFAWVFSELSTCLDESDCVVSYLV